MIVSKWKCEICGNEFIKLLKEQGSASDEQGSDSNGI